MACIATSMASLSLANAAATRRAGKPAVALSARRSVAAQPRVASHAGVTAGRGSLQVFAVRSRSNTGGSRKGLLQYVERVNAPQVKDDLIPFRVGMTVRVGVTVVEGNKTRVQPYEGIIIGVHKAGVATTITVRKAFQGYGVERIFPIHSPLCTFEEVRGAGKPVVRRAKLYYLRDRIGKQAKLKTRFVAKKTGPTRHQLKMEALAATKAAAAAAAEAEAAEAAEAEEAAAPAEEEAAAEPEA
uniref:Ribosomal protein L19 n=1 Tax=Micromonas pusilla TaxID=38833 RepID=A0A7S0NK70_MICPS|mmetsp:Transcript_2624/g.10650  ORF Transcript_2624/g.10650 Transcript_2624/m.10650 type:complete len:243 (+) Transcript_2624:122-850(+)